MISLPMSETDSKAVKSIAEIDHQLQETKAALERRSSPRGTPTRVSELLEREQETKSLTDYTMVWKN
jgi:hypothetical protein